VAIQNYFYIAQIILSVALVAAILLQTRGGGLGSLFGGDASPGQYKTRRGLEKTLFQVTIGISVAFFIIAIVNVFLLGRG
jgi:preprotein translocase subunit SecG